MAVGAVWSLLNVSKREAVWAIRLAVRGRVGMAGRVGRVGVLTAAVVVVASATGLTAAEARRVVRVASHVSIKSSGLTFSGRVTSTVFGCVLARKVTLYRTNGNVLGSVTTGTSGRWKVTASGSAGITLGHFFAKVSPSSFSVGGPVAVCKAATSRTIPYHQ